MAADQLTPLQVNSFHVLIFTPLRRPAGSAVFELLIKDKAMMHAGLVITANHWITLGGARNRIETTFYYHKVEAIRTINEGLSNPTLAISDGIVRAVACITILEVSDRVQCLQVLNLTNRIKGSGRLS